ncbi:MAG: class I SAM-dependent methyltransferase [bacterium]
MSYKIRMLDALSPIEWSQATWRIEAGAVTTDECDRKLITPRLLEYLPRDGLIVDAGCGTAKWVIFLRRLGYRVVGIDISLEASRRARRAAPDTPIVVADAQRTPLPDASVDAILSLGVVEHDEAGPQAALRELRRILRPDGVLMLEVPFDNLLRRLLTNHIDRLVNWRRRRAGWKLGFSEYRFALRELRGLLEHAGFEVQRAWPDDYRPPHNMGLWVDYCNITFNPFFPPRPDELFLLPGRAGRILTAIAARLPWLTGGEVIVLARPRANG